MYTLGLTITEYIGAVGVRGYWSDIDENGDRLSFGRVVERMCDRDEHEEGRILAAVGAVIAECQANIDYDSCNPRNSD